VGLATSLVSRGVAVEFIGSDELDCPEVHADPRLTFLNLRGDVSREAGRRARVARVLRYYGRLLRYASTAEPELFHILWNNRFQYFDRTLLTLYYRALGKRVAVTAHNVNAGRRDSSDSLLNRLTLACQYRLAHTIFVHTPKMKRELIEDFGVRENAIAVIPYGINNAVPDSGLTPAEAKASLGVDARDKTLLAFGNIAPYKGLEYAVAAFHRLVRDDPDYRLIIAGRPKRGAEGYLDAIRRTIAAGPAPDRVLQRIEHIPDDAAERYFKAADLLLLPYTDIFQSGVLFFGYSFGLPVVVADVGSLRDDVVPGVTGEVCRPRDADDLRLAIERYFSSDLFRHLDRRRHDIRALVAARHSWDEVGQLTKAAYDAVLNT
jgi:glycosyltransferase involved in cell wall biosynthesis